MPYLHNTLSHACVLRLIKIHNRCEVYAQFNKDGWMENDRHTGDTDTQTMFLKYFWKISNHPTYFTTKSP